MNNHFKQMHLLLLKEDEGQSKLSNQGAVPLHRFALNNNEKFLLSYIPNTFNLMVWPLQK